MTGADGPRVLLEDRRSLDPVAELFGGLASDAGAHRWILCFRHESRWRALSQGPTHIDDLYVRLAEGLDQPVAITFAPSVELGSPGMRLDAAGVRGLGIVLLAAGTDPVVGFLEGADRDKTEALAAAWSVDALTQIGSLVPTLWETSRRAAELAGLSRCLPALRSVSRAELDEPSALKILAELLEVDCLISIGMAGGSAQAIGAWRDGSGTWRRYEGVIHEHVDEHPLDAGSMPALATEIGANEIGASGPSAWSVGFSNEARPLTLAASGGLVSVEGLSVAAALLSAAVKRGRDLSAAKTNALLQERARIASMIHEGITQVLTNVVLQMEVLARLMDEPKAAREMLAKLRAAILEALDSLRGAILELTPAAPEWSDLAGGLERFTVDFAAQWGLEVGYTVTGSPREVDPDVLALVFGFVQEGLSNVRKHAGVSEAQVSLNFTDDMVRVDVVDRGAGFDPHRTEEEGFRQHQGLSIMRSRARLAGGSFEVGSRAGQGTTATLELRA